MARAQGVDLVEVNPAAAPPVCRLVDFGKYRYEQAKREKESRKHQHANKVKEIQLSPNIDPHDFSTKLQHAIDFLCEDMKVKITLRFRGREMAHKEIGFQQVERLAQSLMPFGHPDAPAKLIGKGINVMISPLPRGKRAKNPKGSPEGGSGDGSSSVSVTPTMIAPVKTPPANTVHIRDGNEARPVEAGASGGQEFGSNAFASLEFKPRG